LVVPGFVFWSLMMAGFPCCLGVLAPKFAPKAYRCHSSHAGTRLAPGELESFSANPLLQHHRLRTAPAGKRPDRLFDSDSRRRHHPVCLRHNDAKRLPGRGRTCTRPPSDGLFDNDWSLRYSARDCERLRHPVSPNAPRDCLPLALDATPGRARSRILSKSVEPSGYPLRLGLPEPSSDRC